MESLEEAYLDFKQGLMNDSVALGKPQREEFFENYSSLGSEAGEFTDLEYSPIKFDDPNRPYQIDGYSLEEDSGTLHLIICNLNMSDETEETLKPIGVFSTEQGENSNEICFGFKRYK